MSNLDPVEDPSSLGNVLLSIGAVSKDDLRRALDEQAKMGDVILGKVMVNMGLITEEVLDEAIQVQQLMKGTLSAHTQIDKLNSKISEARDLQAELEQLIGERMQDQRDIGEPSGEFLASGGPRR